MNRNGRVAVCVAMLLLGEATSASACTVCSSTNGREVRAGIFANDFARTFFKVTLPIPALAVCAWAAATWLSKEGRTEN